MLDELRPPNHDYSHQDSLFGNAFSSRAYFIVHPEWLSENVDPPKSKPLDRKPWPWEIPKYRQNIRHEMQKIINGNKAEEEAKKTTPPTNNEQVPTYQNSTVNQYMYSDATQNGTTQNSYGDLSRLYGGLR